MTTLAAAMVVSTCAFAITISTTGVISSPTYFNGFEGFTGTYDFASATAARYSEGGISVSYKDTATGQLSTTPITPISSYPYWGGMGQYQWYEPAPGYTTLTLTSGGNFQSLQFLASSGWIGTTTSFLEYEVLEHGSLIAAGTLAINAVCCYVDGDFGSFATVGFTGGGFDQVLLQDTATFANFDPNQLQALALDNVAADPATPLPAALPLFATGIGGLGLLGWRKRKVQAVA